MEALMSMVPARFRLNYEGPAVLVNTAGLQTPVVVRLYADGVSWRGLGDADNEVASHLFDLVQVGELALALPDRRVGTVAVRKVEPSRYRTFFELAGVGPAPFDVRLKPFPWLMSKLR